MGLVTDEEKIELETEKRIDEKLKQNKGIIVVGYPLSGLTTLYLEYRSRLPDRKLCIEEYKHNPDDKNKFTDIMDALRNGQKVALFIPEYTFKVYLDEYLEEHQNEQQADLEKEIKEYYVVTHSVSKDEAREFLQRLIKKSKYAEMFDNDLKERILNLVKQTEEDGSIIPKNTETYPLKLLKDVFEKTQKRFANGDQYDKIKADLDRKIKIKDETEEFLSAGIILGITSIREVAPHLRKLIPQSVYENIKQLLHGITALLSIPSPAFSLFAIAAILPDIREFLKHRREKKITQFDKYLQLKEYWDSLNDSERKMLCYKLDKKNGLKPGASEEYLNYIFTNKWKDVENEINEIKNNLNSFENRLKTLEGDYPKIKELLDKMSQINADINLIKDNIEFLMKEVKELKLKFDLLKQQVQGKFVIADSDEFAEGSLYRNVRVKNGRLMIRVENSYYQIVETGGFGNSVNRGIDVLGKRGIVVLNGPRGVGKSTLVASVIWNLFEKGDIGLVVKVESLSDRDQLSLFKTFIEKYHEKYEEFLSSLLVLYDPSSTTFYETTKGDVNVSPINDTVNNLFDIISCDKKVKLLIVLPTDIYNAMSKDIREKLDRYRLDVSLNQVEFLKEVIKAYSCNESPNNCCNKLSDDDFNQLAEEIAEYEEGYTLIARLVGMELAKSDCNVDDIKRMIEKSEHNASVFIVSYIKSFFDVVDDNRVRALVEIFALRRPFVYMQSAESPILTRGIVEVIRRANDPRQMSPEMINWLVYRQHDLIENTIKRLLDGEDLGRVSEPWRFVIRTNMPKITSAHEAVEYFINKYGKEFVKELSQFSDCWKRAALITGHVLTMWPKLPDKRKFSNSEIVDVLNSCGIDDYLLVDNEIPYFVEMLVTLLYINGSSPFTRIFTNEYENAINEAKKLLEIWKRKFNNLEAYYALGLALIVAEAARLGKAINEDDANTILKATLAAVPLTFHPFHVKHILEALGSLRNKAPQQYLEILFLELQVSEMELDAYTARLIYDEVNYILSNFFNRLMKLVWPLVTAVEIYSSILSRHTIYFTDEEFENIAKNMCNLLNALKKESNELATIAEASTLIPALEYSKLFRDFISEYCSVKDPVTRADEIRKSLKELANKSDELLKNEYFMNWSTFVPWISQQDIRKLITDMEAHLTFSLAEYKLDNYEFDEALKLFNEAAEAYKSIEDWRSYINTRVWFLRAEVLKARSINEYVNVSDFEKLWNETLEKLKFMAGYLDGASVVLNNYLVYLASIGRYDDIEKMLRSKYAHLLINYSERVSVLTRLMLRLLGFTKVAEVKPEELIDAYKDYIYPYFLPALKLTLGIEASVKECESLKALEDRNICRYAFFAVKGKSYALTMLRNSLNVMLRELVQGLDGKALVQLLAPRTSRCRLALMLYALVSGNTELAKEHARWGSEEYRSVGRLFGDVYEACCDVSSEGFKLALLKLYYYHI
jgi:GTPase SAR1 family protein